MEITELKEVLKREHVVVGYQCDVCHNKIHDDYWHLRTGHTDWGNDSVESVRSFDLCSKDCVLAKLLDYFKDCNSSNTQYFELEQEIYSVKGGS